MVQFGKDKYKEALMSMWKLCFPHDTDNFIHFYFNEVYKNEETLVYIERDRSIAALQMIPYRIKTADSFLSGAYISGAMTHPDFQRKGYMEKLILSSFDVMREKAYALTFLIPQEEGLFRFYEKYGYRKAFPEQAVYRCPVVPQCDSTITVVVNFSGINLPNFYSIYTDFLLTKEKVVLKTELQLTQILWTFFDEKGILFFNDEGLAFTFKRENEIILKEFFCRNEEMKERFLQAIAAYYSTNEVVICNDPAAPTVGYKGMIKTLNDSREIHPDIYISMMLE